MRGSLHHTCGLMLSKAVVIRSLNIKLLNTEGEGNGRYFETSGPPLHSAIISSRLPSRSRLWWPPGCDGHHRRARHTLYSPHLMSKRLANVAVALIFFSIGSPGGRTDGISWDCRSQNGLFFTRSGLSSSSLGSIISLVLTVRPQFCIADRMPSGVSGVALVGAVLSSIVCCS